MANQENGWGQYERLVLNRLDRIDAEMKEIKAEIHNLQMEEIGKMKIEIAMLKVKSGAWGATAGAVPAAIIALYFLLGGGPG